MSSAIGANDVREASLHESSLFSPIIFAIRVALS